MTFDAILFFRIPQPPSGSLPRYVWRPGPPLGVGGSGGPPAEGETADWTEPPPPRFTSQRGAESRLRPGLPLIEQQPAPALAQRLPGRLSAWWPRPPQPHSPPHAPCHTAFRTGMRPHTCAPAHARPSAQPSSPPAPRGPCGARVRAWGLTVLYHLKATAYGEAARPAWHRPPCSRP